MKADSLQTPKHSKPLYILTGLIYFVSLFQYRHYISHYLLKIILLKSFKGLVHLTSIFYPQALYPVAQVRHQQNTVRPYLITAALIFHKQEREKTEIIYSKHSVKQWVSLKLPVKAKGCDGSASIQFHLACNSALSSRTEEAESHGLSSWSRGAQGSQE